MIKYFGWLNFPVLLALPHLHLSFRRHRPFLFPLGGFGWREPAPYRHPETSRNHRDRSESKSRDVFSYLPCFNMFRHISTLFKSQAPVLSSRHLVGLKPSNLQWFKLSQNWSLFASSWEPHLQKSSKSWPSAPSWCTRMLRCYRVHWVGTVIRPVANRQKVNVSVMLKDADGTRLSIPVYTSVQHHSSIVLWTWHLLLTIKWYVMLVAETCWKHAETTESLAVLLSWHGLHQNHQTAWNPWNPWDRQKSVYLGYHGQPISATRRSVSGHGHSSASCGPVAPLLVTVFISLWQAALLAFGIDIPTPFPLKASKSYKI